MERSRHPVVWGLALLCTWFAGLGTTRADIYQWEYINPADPSQGKQPSATLAPGGAGVHAVPLARFRYRNLTKAYLIGANLHTATFSDANLQDADLSQANLTYAWFARATLTDATFTGAHVRWADFGSTISRGFTAAQLYSTASYQDQDLEGIGLYGNNLTGWNFAGQNLRYSNFSDATLTDTDFTGAHVPRAYFSRATSFGFTAAQLYSTASYQSQDLTGISLDSNNLAGWDFVGQNLAEANFHRATLSSANLSQANLTNAQFTDTTLTDADFTGAVVRGTDFRWSTVTAEQLYSTASYQAHDLAGIRLDHINLTGWNFAGQNLTAAYFFGATLTNTDFTGADTRGAIFPTLPSSAMVVNLIRHNGRITGLDLTDGRSLLVRHDIAVNRYGWPRDPIAIRVWQHLTMDTSGLLALRLEEAWNSTISFEPGIPVALDGTLELTFAPDFDVASHNGQTFQLFDWTGVTPTGTFAEIRSDFDWDLSRIYTTGEVTLWLTGLPGDFNLDGTVDAADYTVWRNGLGTTFSAADYFTWKAHFGQSLAIDQEGALLAAVPEPAAWLGLVLAVTLALRGRRRRASALSKLK